MASNYYHCENCGLAEYYFKAGHPPKDCEDCGAPLDLRIAPNQFFIGGEMAWLTEKEKDSIAIQLGERPTCPEHLRQIEQRLGVERGTKYDFVSATDSGYGKPDPKPGWLAKTMYEDRKIAVKGLK